MPRWLIHPPHRHGPWRAGGTGKTLLGLRLLQQAQAGFEHGVCLVDLAPVTEAAAVASVVATALGMAAGRCDPLAGLCEAVAPLRLLLVLDNAEHLLAEVVRVIDATRTRWSACRCGWKP